MAKKRSRYDAALEKGYTVKLGVGIRENFGTPATPRGFENFSSPSVEVGRRMAAEGKKISTGAAAKRENECLQAEKKTKTGGKRKVWTGFRKDGRWDSFCKTGKTSSPCIAAKKKADGKESLRSSCPVQMVIVKGEYALRFCVTAGSPGELVPVKDTKAARRLAASACDYWKKHDKSFTGFKFPAGTGLGRARKRSRR